LSSLVHYRRTGRYRLEIASHLMDAVAAVGRSISCGTTWARSWA